MYKEQPKIWGGGWLHWKLSFKNWGGGLAPPPSLQVGNPMASSDKGKNGLDTVYRMKTSSLLVIKEIILVRLKMQRLKDIKLFCVS